MKNSKRYKLTIITAIVLIMLAGISIFKGLEVMATACVTGIMTILTSYIWGETWSELNLGFKNNKFVLLFWKY